MNGLVVDGFAGGERKCAQCEGPLSGRPDRKYCSIQCLQRARLVRQGHGKPYERECRACGRSFTCQGRGAGNKWHCSDECGAASARKWRREFDKRHPDRDPVYRDRQRAKAKRDTRLNRFWRKYPDMPRHCEACGESRVLDAAHKPEHRRLGAWQSMKNTTPEQIWVLCPTCHALLDRLGYTPEQLGIKPRAPEAATQEAA